MNQFAIDRTHFCKRSRDNILIMVCTVFAEADEEQKNKSPPIKCRCCRRRSAEIISNSDNYCMVNYCI